MDLDDFITLEQAAEKYEIERKLLTKLVQDGKIKAGRLDSRIILQEDEVKRASMTKEKIWARVAHLDGQGIGMAEAARKYNMHHRTVSRWAQAGYIRVLKRDGPGKKVLVNEADVAYAKHVFEIRDAGRGRKTFTNEYIPGFVTA